MKEKILVTGATGFIGQNLIQRLCEMEYPLAVLLRKGSKQKLIDLDLGIDFNKQVQIIEIEEGVEAFQQSIQNFTPEVCIHLASCFLVNHTLEDIQNLVSSNVEFPTRLAEALVNSGCQTLINTGTFWQHFHTNDYLPVNLYSATKQACEDILKYYSDAKSLQVINLKLSDTYGKGDPRKKLMHLLKKQMSADAPFGMSPGDQLIDILHIDDVINGFVSVLENRNQYSKFEDLALRSETPLSLKQLVSVFENVTNTNLQIEFGKLPHRDRQVMKTWDGGRVPTGWKQEVSLEDGIQRFVG